MNESKWYIVTAATAAGKDTVGKALFKLTPSLLFSVSATSRPKRSGEQNGKEYFFMSRDEFLRKVENGDFIEWNEYAGNLYGTLKVEVERIMKSDRPALFILDINGTKKLKDFLADKVTSFFLHTSLDIIEKRLRGRKTESEIDIQKRLKIAEGEIERRSECDHVVYYGEGADPEATAKHINYLMIGE